MFDSFPLESFRAYADAMLPFGEPADWQWIGCWESQRMFGITEAMARAYAERHGGEARQMEPTDDGLPPEIAHRRLAETYDLRTMLVPQNVRDFPATFEDVSARFAARVWEEAASLERQRRYPTITLENWGEAFRFQDAEAARLLTEAGLPYVGRAVTPALV